MYRADFPVALLKVYPDPVSGESSVENIHDKGGTRVFVWKNGVDSARPECF